MDKIIFQVDTFTDVYFGGNPAGVVPDATGLDDETMQKIAREMNVSETAFVFPVKDESADVEVRFFTPTQEVDLCGHATIAAFYTLIKKGYLHTNRSKNSVKQKTKAGILPVKVVYKNRKLFSILMTQPKPYFGEILKDTKNISHILGINEEDIGLKNHGIHPQMVSTGILDIMLPVKSREVLKKIDPDYEKLKKYSKEKSFISIHAFTMEGEEKGSTLSCRNFAPLVGINEEAATGTSNGALGAYLVKNDIIKLENKKTLICEQGYGMNRPSKVIVQLTGTKNDFSIQVGGQAIITLEGVVRSK